MSAPFRPKQSLGQHFLRAPNTARKIAGALHAEAGDAVVEIGPGDGALTEVLLEKHPGLLALELDQRAVRALRDRFPEKQHPALDVREADATETDWPALAQKKGAPLHVIGNLPYNVTSPILFALLDARSCLAEAVLTMQKEVAERLTAEPRTKAYGIPSVLAQLWCAPELCFDVSPHVFSPQPRVNSAVVRLDFQAETDAAQRVDDDWLRRVVRTAFGKRRKMLRNSLREWTKDAGISFPHDGWDRKRPEALAPAELAELARYLRERLDERA
jgi:16S rRNA (adenine1518-N6/adenine1519-N6)-dimethyltransferase